LAAQLAETGHRAIVCGTINFDEGSYLGYLSKSSDAMTDVQLISDLHKSEVKKMAEYLQIPEEIKNAIANGDMYDNRSDETVFGTSYDFVELYSWFLQLSEAEQAQKLKSWPAATRAEFELLRTNLERLHAFNKHKYTVVPQGLHFTLFEANIPGGWTLIKYV
jgi:NH3-dependent NAD+ synthetase